MRWADAFSARASTEPWDVGARRYPEVVSHDRDELIRLIRDEALFHGDFTLTSGQRASFYIDLRKLSLDHRAAPLIGRILLELVDEFEPVDAVGGLTMGADPLASSVLHQGVAQGRKIDAFVVRKQPKDHGRGRQIEGADVAGKRVVVLEDTSTTGGSPLTAIAALERAGATVLAVCVVVDRGTEARNRIETAGYAYRYAIGLDDLGLADAANAEAPASASTAPETQGQSGASA